MEGNDYLETVGNSLFSDSGRELANIFNELADNLINTAREHFIILNKGLRVIKVSCSFTELFKLSINDTIGKSIFDLANHQFDIPELRELLEIILPQKTIINNYEVEHSFTIIGRRTLQLNVRQIELGKAKEKIILLAIDDITERKNILMESEDRYSKAFQTSPYGLTITRAEDGRFLEVNETFISITGFTREELLADSSIGLKLWVDPEDRNRFTKALFETKEVKDKEFQFRLRNGDILEGMISAQIISLNNEPCILSSISNITERKLIEQELKESEERFRTLYEDSTIGLYRTTPDGKIILANPTLLKMLGYSSFEDLASRNLERDGFEPAYERKNFREQIENEGEINKLESIWTRQDGVVVYISESAKAIRDSDGNTMYYDGTVEDISERKRAEKALRESEYELNVILESTADGILAIDSKGKVIKVNRRFAELWNIPDDLLSKNDDAVLLNYAIEQLVDPEEFLAKVRLLYKSTEKDNDLLHFKDGRVFERYSVPLIMEDSSIGRVWSFHDITKRKQAEDLLHLSEEKYRHLIDNMQEGVYITDDNGVILFANNALARIHGCKSPDELVNKNFIDFIEQSEKKVILENFKNELKSGNSIREIEVPIVRMNGSIANVLIRPFIIRNGDGTETASGIVRDITDRKRSEEKLVKLYSAVEQIVDTIVITNRSGIIEYVNPAFEKLTGYSVEETVGKTLSIIKSGLKDQKFYEELWKTILSGKVFKTEFVNRKKDGELYYEEKTISPIFDKNKNITHFVGTGVDITERKKTEFTIQEQYTQLKELNSSKDKFFSIIAHDLKSPFSGFMNLTEIMAVESKDFSISEFAELSKSLNESAVNLFKLLENLLEWASIKQGVMSFDLKPLNLSSVVSANILTIAERAAQKGIILYNQVDESLAVLADEKMINTVFRNLLSNAVKFTRRGDTVKVNAKSGGNDFIEIMVSDTGVGIPVKDLIRLFKIDEKVSSVGTDNELSTGLGLLLCREFLEKQGGRIWVESEVGKGSIFHFTLPGCSAK